MHQEWEYVEYAWICDHTLLMWVSIGQSWVCANCGYQDPQGLVPWSCHATNTLSCPVHLGVNTSEWYGWQVFCSKMTAHEVPTCPIHANGSVWLRSWINSWKVERKPDHIKFPIPFFEPIMNLSLYIYISLYRRYHCGFILACILLFTVVTFEIMWNFASNSHGTISVQHAI